MNTAQLWPHYATLADLPGIEEVPLAERGLPTSTRARRPYDSFFNLQRAVWHHRCAIGPCAPTSLSLS